MSDIASSENMEDTGFKNTMSENITDSENSSASKEINIPVADPNDPYAVPAAMPSSADKSVRSFNVEDFAIPTRKQEDWRYTPVERISEFFAVSYTHLTLPTTERV